MWVSCSVTWFVLVIWFTGADYLALAVCCGGLLCCGGFELWVFV